MRERKNVDRLLAVFDLAAPKDLGLPENWSTRVMLVYDREKQVKEYTLLCRGLPEAVIRKVTSWLETHVNIEEMAYCLGSGGYFADPSTELHPVLPA